MGSKPGHGACSPWPRAHPLASRTPSANRWQLPQSHTKVKEASLRRCLCPALRALPARAGLLASSAHWMPASLSGAPGAGPHPSVRSTTKPGYTEPSRDSQRDTELLGSQPGVSPSL